MQGKILIRGASMSSCRVCFSAFNNYLISDSKDILEKSPGRQTDFAQCLRQVRRMLELTVNIHPTDEELLEIYGRVENQERIPTFFHQICINVLGLPNEGDGQLFGYALCLKRVAFFLIEKLSICAV